MVTKYEGTRPGQRELRVEVLDGSCRVWAPWPGHRVTDGIDQLEVLLDRGLLVVHPRCTGLKAAFLHYARRRTGHADWLDEPADPQHPHEDLMDALRGGVRDRFPEGR